MRNQFDNLNEHDPGTARTGGLASITDNVSLAWSRVSSLAAAVDTNLDRWLTDTYRLGLTDFRALTLLGQSSDKEMRVNDLAQQIGLNPSSATRLVSRLETKGLAYRDVCQDDGRGVYAVINQAGEALLGETRAPFETRVRELLEKSGAHLPQLDPRSIATALSEVSGLLAP